MKSLTIHGIDDVLDRKLKIRSIKGRLSLNKTIKNLLSESLGVSGRKSEPDHSDDFTGFLGKWSKNDVAQQNKSLEYSRSVNMEEWK